MKRIAGLLFLIVAMAAALAQTPSSSAGQKLSPAERNMAQARKPTKIQMTSKPITPWL